MSTKPAFNQVQSYTTQGLQIQLLSLQPDQDQDLLPQLTTPTPTQTQQEIIMETMEVEAAQVEFK